MLVTVEDAITEPFITAKPSDTIIPFASAPLAAFIKKYDCMSLCLITVSSTVSKVLYPSVFTSNLALLINSCSIASSYSDMEEQVGTVLFMTIDLPAFFANK